jgi:hypothetical protein
MSQALKSIISMEPKICTVSDINLPTIFFEVFAPNGESIGDPFSSYCDMLNELMFSDIGDEVVKQFKESFEGTPRDFEMALNKFAWEHLENIAVELGYRIERKAK